MSELPPMRKAVEIRFISKRLSIISSTMYNLVYVQRSVLRMAYRTNAGDSWKWQIKGLIKRCRYIHDGEMDQDILNNYGSDMTNVWIIEQVDVS